jgi:hypothetical protein
VHPFVATILLWMARLDALDADRLIFRAAPFLQSIATDETGGGLNHSLQSTKRRSPLQKIDRAVILSEKMGVCGGHGVYILVELFLYGNLCHAIAALAGIGDVRQIATSQLIYDYPMTAVSYFLPSGLHWGGGQKTTHNGRRLHPDFGPSWSL